MERLVMGMYGTEHRSDTGLFGLRCGKLQAGCVVHDAGWYNAKGEKLGWGDLTSADFRRIADELHPDEIFIILDKYGSHFSVPPGTREDAPGVEYVVEKCVYAICQCRKLKVSDDAEARAFLFHGLDFDVVTRAELRAMLTGVA